MQSDQRPIEAEEYWQRRYEEDFTLEGSGYKGLGQEFNKWAYRAQGRAFMKAVRPFLRAGSERVLDIGSGTGFFVERWHELGVGSVTGSDIAVKSVETLARRHPADRFVQLDIGSDGSAGIEGRFDVISAMGVVFHIMDDVAYERAFRNMFALLEPGGLLFFSENFYRSDPLTSGHQTGRLDTDIESAVHSAGFEVIKRRPMFFLTNGPTRSRSRILRSWWLRLNRLLLRSATARRLAGAAVYPFEVALVSLARRGPSIELMVCRKPDQSEPG